MLPTTFLFLALLAAAAGLVAFIASTELFSAGQILNPYFNWLSRAVGPEAPLAGRKRRDWLYKPLGGCLACMAGQMGLWAYAISAGYQFHPGHAAFTICGAIFVATQLKARN